MLHASFELGALSAVVGRWCDLVETLLEASVQENAKTNKTLDDALVLRGFVAGEHVHEFQPNFTLDDVKAALFQSTYSNPQSLIIRLDEVTLRVVVASMGPLYIPLTVEPGDKPLGCYEHPSWRIEGWLLKSGFDPYGEVVRVRIVIDTAGTSSAFDGAYIQRVPGAESIPLT